MEIKEIRNKLFNKLIGTGWDNELRFFVKSSEFDDILFKLMMEVETGFRFTPVINDIFKPFELCHLDKVKVVFIYPEPWLDPIINQGLAISNKGVHRTVPQQAWKFVSELKKQIPQTNVLEADLTDWCNQGVLLLNQSFTTRISTPNKHNEIWQPFLNYVMEILIRRNPVFVFIGRHPFEDVEAFELPEIPTHWNKEWETHEIFLKINEQLLKNNISPIIW